MALPQEVTDPGLINVETQGFARAILDADGSGVQVADQASAAPPTRNVDAGVAPSIPTGMPREVISNTVVGQVYGTGTPINVTV